MSAAAEATDDPAARLQRISAAYIEFANDYREEYRLATMLPRTVGTAVDRVLVSVVHPQFRTAVEALVADGSFAGCDIDQRVLEIWAVVHGLTTLLVAGRLSSGWQQPGHVAAMVVYAAQVGHSMIDLDHDFLRASQEQTNIPRHTTLAIVTYERDGVFRRKVSATPAVTSMARRRTGCRL